MQRRQPGFGVQVGNAQAAEFGDAQAAGVHQLDHGAIAHADCVLRVRLAKQAVHFLDAQKFGQALAEFRRFNGDGGIVLDVAFHEREAEKVADGDEMARNRAAIETPAI